MIICNNVDKRLIVRSGKNIDEYQFKKGPAWKTGQMNRFMNESRFIPLKKPIYINSFFVVIFSHE
jgi:hypothetical protein